MPTRVERVENAVPELCRLIGNIKRLDRELVRVEVELDRADPESAGRHYRVDVDIAAFFRCIPLMGDRVVMWRDVKTLIVCRVFVLAKHPSSQSYREYSESGRHGSWLYDDGGAECHGGGVLIYPVARSKLRAQMQSITHALACAMP